MRREGERRNSERGGERRNSEIVGDRTEMKESERGEDGE